MNETLWASLLKLRKEIDQFRENNEKISDGVDEFIMHTHAELSCANSILCGYLVGKEVDKYSDLICEGMQNPDKFLSADYKDFKLTDEEAYQTLRACTDCLVLSGIEYIDRWRMYNNLFSERD